MTQARQRLVIGIGASLVISVDRSVAAHRDGGYLDFRHLLGVRQMVHRGRRHLANREVLSKMHVALDYDLGLRRHRQLDRLARHHLNIPVHDGADHFHLAPHVQVQAGKIAHDLVGGRDSKNEGDRHLVFAHRSILIHDDMRVRSNEADQTSARPDGVRAGVT